MRLRFDDGDAVDVDLGPAVPGRARPGGDLPRAHVPTSCRSRSWPTPPATRRPLRAASPASGFAEVADRRRATRRLDEVVRLPTDLLDAAGRRRPSTTRWRSASPACARTPPTPPATTRSAACAAAFTLPDGPPASRLERRGPAVAAGRRRRDRRRCSAGPTTARSPWARASSRPRRQPRPRRPRPSTATPPPPGPPPAADPSASGSRSHLPEPPDHRPPPADDRRRRAALGAHRDRADGRRRRSRRAVRRARHRRRTRQNATADGRPRRCPSPSPGRRSGCGSPGSRAVTTNDWVERQRAVDQPVAIAEIGLPGPKVPARPATVRQRLPRRPAHASTASRAVRITGDDRRRPGRPSRCRSRPAATAPRPVELDGGDHELRSPPRATLRRSTSTSWCCGRRPAARRRCCRPTSGRSVGEATAARRRRPGRRPARS